MIRNDQDVKTNNFRSLITESGALNEALNLVLLEVE